MRATTLMPIVLAAVCFLGVITERPAVSADTQAEQHFDLQQLRALCQGKLSPNKAARAYLSFLRQEAAAPSAPAVGVGGGPVTHDYILAQIILAGMEAGVQQDVLLREAAKAEPGEFRDAVLLTLGLLGNHDATPFVIAYLADPRHPALLRERAARALHLHPSADVIPALAAALEDPFYVLDAIGPKKVYELRVTAASALRRLRDNGVALPAAVEQELQHVVLAEPVPAGSTARK
jgi:hypothetical protein